MREVIGYDRNHSGRADNDYYATPPEEVKNILQYEKLYEPILDPCCGEGHMVEPVRKKHSDVLATDLIDRGYGGGGLDFLDVDYPYIVNTVIMNPPFRWITEFVVKALAISFKVLLFARLQFLETSRRYEEIFKDKPPGRIYIYVDRVSCAINGDFTKKRHSSMAYAWYVWDSFNDEQGVYWIRKWSNGSG